MRFFRVSYIGFGVAIFIGVVTVLYPHNIENILGGEIRGSAIYLHYLIIFALVIGTGINAFSQFKADYQSRKEQKTKKNLGMKIESKHQNK